MNASSGTADWNSERVRLPTMPKGTAIFSPQIAEEAEQPKTLHSICFYKKPGSRIAAVRVLLIHPLPALGRYLAISNIIF